MQRITPFLTFEKQGLEATKFYVSIFQNSYLDTAMTVPGTDQLLNASFVLDGQEFMAMDGGEHFKFSDGNSLFVTCNTQDEVDYYWEKLAADGGEPGQCGWLKDRFGMSWQIVPTQLGELMSSPDHNKSLRVRDAMLKMGKLDIKQLQDAYDGN